MDIMTYDFSFYRRSIIVKAEITGVKEKRNVTFLLDTGASKTIIDEDAAKRLGFELKQFKTGDRLMTANGGVNSKILELPKFSLLGKDLIDFEVNVLTLPVQISYFADGLIGMDFLLQFDSIKFDFDKKIIET